MKDIKKVIFVGKNALIRCPMAVSLLRKESLRHPIEIEARGLVVLFPEPMNPKAQAVLISKEFNNSDYMSCQLESSDFADTTLILTFESGVRDKVKQMEGAQNVYVLTEVTGDELEIMNPYGADLKTYAVCFETIRNAIRKLVDILNERSFFADEEKTGEPRYYDDLATEEEEEPEFYDEPATVGEEEPEFYDEPAAVGEEEPEFYDEPATVGEEKQELLAEAAEEAEEKQKSSGKSADGEEE